MGWKRPPYIRGTAPDGSPQYILAVSEYDLKLITEAVATRSEQMTMSIEGPVRTTAARRLEELSQEFHETLKIVR